MKADREPERWLIADEELANQLRPVLRMARGNGPSPSEHARIWSMLAERLPVAADGGKQTAATENPLKLAGRPGLWRLAGTAVLAAVCGFSLAVWLSSRASERYVPAPRTPSRVQAHAVPEALPSVRSIAPDTIPSANAHSTDAPATRMQRKHAVVRSLKSNSSAATIAAPAPVAVDENPPPDLAGELDLLSRARRIVVSEPSRALQLTAEHARRFQEGVLSQEREVLAIEALSRLGQRDLAAARARRFIARYPDSAHRTRLAAELEVP